MSRSQRSPWLCRIHIGAGSPKAFCISAVIFFSASINASNFPGAAWIKLALYMKGWSCAFAMPEKRRIVTSQHRFRNSGHLQIADRPRPNPGYGEKELAERGGFEPPIHLLSV